MRRDGDQDGLSDNVPVGCASPPFPRRPSRDDREDVAESGEGTQNAAVGWFRRCPSARQPLQFTTKFFAVLKGVGKIFSTWLQSMSTVC